MKTINTTPVITIPEGGKWNLSNDGARLINPGRPVTGVWITNPQIDMIFIYEKNH